MVGIAIEILPGKADLQKGRASDSLRERPSCGGVQLRQFGRFNSKGHAVRIKGRGEP